MCTIKLFRVGGGRGGDSLSIPSPYEQGVVTPSVSPPPSDLQVPTSPYINNQFLIVIHQNLNLGFQFQKKLV